MKKSKQQEFTAIQFILIATVLVLSFLNIARYAYNQDPIVGEYPYYHERMSLELLEGIPKEDSLSYGGTQYILNPYHALLGFFTKITESGLSSKFLPFILGFASLLFFYNILIKLNINIKKRFLATILLLLSPPFIYNSFVSNNVSFVLFLDLLGLLLFMNRKKHIYLFSIIPAIILPFLGIFHAFSFFLIILTYSFYKKRYDKVIILSIFLLISTFYSLSLYGGFTKLSFLQRSLLGNFITEMGALQGLSLFAIILGFIGINVLWKYKTKFYPVYLSSFVLIILSLFKGADAGIYLALFFSFFGGYGFYKLMYMAWEVKVIKDLTLFLLVAGIVVSSFSYSLRLVNSDPNKEIMESLDWLNQNADYDLVLSHYSKGFWIEQRAEFPVFMDSLFITSIDPDSRYKISNEIFYSRDLRKTTSLLKTNKIRYIWIDNNMKQGRVWTENDEGILFLFKNNETFKNIYEDSGVEIWEFLLGEN